jgi:hypothetical protein
VKNLHTENISSGFTGIDVDEKVMTRCLLCMKTLAADGMKLDKLKRRLEIIHAEFVGKTPDFFLIGK